MKFQQVYSWLILLTVATVLGYLVGLVAEKSIADVYAQSEKKIVKLAYSRKSQLKITEARTGQQKRKFDESFDAEAEWVKDLSFKLENVSGKSIVYLQVNVNFPETRSSGELMSYGIVFGELPGKKLKYSKPMLLMPGETLEVSLDKEKDKIYKFVNERQSIESIQKLELEIGFIVFEDKIAWAAGDFLRQDPNNPNRYNNIGSEPPR